MTINWDALSVIVALLTFAAGQMFSWWGGRRVSVVYTHRHISAPTGAMKEIIDEKFGPYLLGNIYANQFEIENKGRHISEFSFRIKSGNLISYRVSKTSSIDEDKIILSVNEKGNLIVDIPDFPAKEKVSIDIFGLSYISLYDPISGGSSRFILTTISEYRDRRIKFLFGSAIAASIAFSVFRSFGG